MLSETELASYRNTSNTAEQNIIIFQRLTINHFLQNCSVQISESTNREGVRQQRNNSMYLALMAGYYSNGKNNPTTKTRKALIKP